MKHTCINPECIGGYVDICDLDGYHLVPCPSCAVRRKKLIINAANGMTTDQAVRYLEYGAEMVGALTEVLNHPVTAKSDLICFVKALLKEMEG